MLLPGESHGQRSLVGCSPWGHKRVRYDLVTKQQQPGHPQFGCGGQAILNDWLMSRFKGMIPRTSYDTHRCPRNPLQWLLGAALVKHHKLCSLLSHGSGEQKSKVRMWEGSVPSPGHRGGAVPGPSPCFCSFPDPWQHNSNLHVVFLRAPRTWSPQGRQQASWRLSRVSEHARRPGEGCCSDVRAVLSYSKFGGTTWMCIPTNSHLSWTWKKEEKTRDWMNILCHLFLRNTLHRDQVNEPALETLPIRWVPKFPPSSVVA